jgi:gamma-glutamylcyclotransferase (GGCT)/AIG2-like uncharacterized protein YtfP
MNLFTYGTLMDAAIMHRVCGEQFRSHAASISGYRRKKLRDEVYPGIIARANSSVEGLVYFDISVRALGFLDEFEGSYYQREAVQAVCADGTAIAAQTYVLRDQFAALLSEEDWNLGDFLQRDKPLFQHKYGGYEKL